MPLGAGVLPWVLVCRTIEKKTEKSNFLLAVPANKVLFAGTVPANKVLFGGTSSGK